MLKKGRKSQGGSGIFRNLSEHLPDLMDRAKWPQHKQIPYKLNKKYGKNMVDPFHWVRSMHQEAEEDFKIAERGLRMHMLAG